MTNDFLNKIGVLPSPACSFCGKENESLEHILISCYYAKDFWAEVIKWLCNLKFNVNSLNNGEIMLGMPDCEDELIVNHVLLIAKQYLYSCRFKNTYPLINVFIARLKKIQNHTMEITSGSENDVFTHSSGKHHRNRTKLSVSGEWINSSAAQLAVASRAWNDILVSGSS